MVFSFVGFFFRSLCELTKAHGSAVGFGTCAALKCGKRTQIARMQMQRHATACNAAHPRATTGVICKNEPKRPNKPKAKPFKANSDLSPRAKIAQMFRNAPSSALAPATKQTHCARVAAAARVMASLLARGYATPLE